MPLVLAALQVDVAPGVVQVPLRWLLKVLDMRGLDTRAAVAVLERGEPEAAARLSMVLEGCRLGCEAAVGAADELLVGIGQLTRVVMKAVLTVERIQEAVAERFRLKVSDLKARSNAKSVTVPRQIAMYLCRELTGLSLPKIGAQFGNRDHTTVMYAERKINQLLGERRAVFNQVSELTNRIKLQARQS